MTSTTIALDSTGRAELYRLLGPLVDDVSAAVAAPPSVAKGDWIGPASHACERLEAELRGRLMVLLGELDRAFANALGAS